MLDVRKRCCARQTDTCAVPRVSCRPALPLPACVKVLNRSRRAHHQQRPQLCRALLTTETAPQTLAEPPEVRVASSSFSDEEDQAGPGPMSTFGVPDVSFVSLVNGKHTVRGRIRLRAPASLVYSMLTDHGSCHRVFSNIVASEVVQAEGSEKEVHQTCRWSFLAFSGTFRISLAVTEQPQRGLVAFRLRHSSFMRDFEGQWTVRRVTASASPSGHDNAAAMVSAGARPSPASPKAAVTATAAAAAAAAESAVLERQCGSCSQEGRAQQLSFEEQEQQEQQEAEAEAAEEWCEVEHVLSVVPGVPVPPPVAYYTRSVFVRQVEGILGDLQRGVAERQARG